MINFLKKIDQLAAVRQVLFISHQGNLLFAGNTTEEIPVDIQPWWSDLLDTFNHPEQLDLIFTQGRCLVEKTEAGSIVILLNNDRGAAKITTACAGVRAKLSSPSVCRKLLLKIFPEVEPQYRSHVVDALLQFANRETGNSLLPFFRRKLAMNPVKADKLLLSLCQLMGNTGLPEALPLLRECASSPSLTQEDSDLARAIILASQVAITQIELDGPPESVSTTGSVQDTSPREAASKSTQTTVSVQSPPSQLPVPVDLNRPEEKEIQTLLQSGKEAEGIVKMVQLIETSAAKRDFRRAEDVREWLIQTSPMSLTEIIRTAECINEEKAASIDPGHLAVWEDLAQFLSPEEFSSLYHALEMRTYKSGEMIANQGEFVSSLFFINSGKVQLLSKGASTETPLKNCSAGEILGAETFFDLSVWTVNAKSLGTEAGVLSWENLLRLKESCPALRTKLMEYCDRFPSINDLFAKNRRNRRQYDRKNVKGKVSMTVLDEKGQATAYQGRGDLLDISRGGVAFLLRFTKKKNAIGLLNRQILMTIRPDGAITPLQRVGLIKAIQCQDFVGNDYSLHIEFDTKLNSTELLHALAKR